MPSLDARLTFRFNIFFLMEIPRHSSPLMLLAPLPRIQLFLFFLAVPAYEISLSPFCSGFQHNTIPLSSGRSIQQNQQKNFPHLAIFDNKKTDNEFSFLTIRYPNFPLTVYTFFNHPYQLEVNLYCNCSKFLLSYRLISL